MNEENAKKLLFEVDDVLKKIPLDYILYGGTLLGAIRDKKFIDVDKDVDFACLIEDFTPVAKDLAKTFENKGFEVHLVNHRHERPWGGLIYGIKLKKYGIPSDLFGWSRINYRRYVVSHYGSFVLVHTAEYLEKRKLIDFYGRRLPVPKDYEGLLREKYGDWRKPHMHFNNVCKPTCRKDLQEGNDFWWV